MIRIVAAALAILFASTGASVVDWLWHDEQPMEVSDVQRTD